MRYRQKIQQSYITKRMKTNVLAIILSGAVATLAIGDAMAQTQNSRSTYFLEGSTYRHEPVSYTHLTLPTKLEV